MKLEEAKISLEQEVKDPFTNIQEPLKCKYACWKIIDYLWAAYLSDEMESDCLNWLKKLYQEAGMTAENMTTFTFGIELLSEAIRRKPLTNKKK